MKVLIEIDLPEESIEFKIMAHAIETYWFLWDFYTNELRGKLKYGHEFESANEAIEWMRDRIKEEVNMDIGD